MDGVVGGVAAHFESLMFVAGDGVEELGGAVDGDEVEKAFGMAAVEPLLVEGAQFAVLLAGGAPCEQVAGRADHEARVDVLPRAFGGEERGEVGFGIEIGFGGDEEKGEIAGKSAAELDVEGVGDDDAVVMADEEGCHLADEFDFPPHGHRVGAVRHGGDGLKVEGNVGLHELLGVGVEKVFVMGGSGADDGLEDGHFGPPNRSGRLKGTLYIS